MGPGEIDSMLGRMPHHWGEDGRIDRECMAIFNMRTERRLQRRMWQLWKTLGGADQITLRELFEDDIHYFELRRCFFTHGRPSSYFMSDAERAQGRKGRPMRKERKRLEKADRQQRAAEKRLQASRPKHPNRVEDSGLRGRESTIRSELTSRGPPSSKPDSAWSITPRPFDGDDYGETDGEEEEHVDYEEASVDGKEDDSDNKIMG